MASPPSSNPGAARPKQAPSTYISSSGQTLDSLPLSTRLNRTVDTIYNFLGLYIVSLLSLDPYAAAQNSRFNTRGPGRTPQGSGANTAAAGRVGSAGSTSWFGGGGRGTGAGPRGSGSGGSGSGGSGRRMGTVDDVRGLECGSCG